MRLFVSHSSALEALRSVPPQVNRIKKFEESVPVPELLCDSRKILAMRLGEAGIRQRPLHILVPRGTPGGKSQDIRRHQTSLPVVPSGLAWELEVPGLESDKVLVAGPEFVFAQQARSLSVVGLVVLGYELCGCYSQFAARVSGFYDRPPLTTARAIAGALDALADMRGISRAREALAWVADGARSPMETLVACELSLPVELGGMGFERPCLNYPVELDEMAARIAGRRICYVDVAWPGVRRGLEYNGAAYHADTSADQRRREALAHMGWALNVLELEHMRDHDLLMAAVALFADEVPHQMGEASKPEGSTALHQRLLAATRFGMGLEPAFFGVPVPKGAVRMHL